MLNQKTTLLLLSGMMCFSSVSGFLTVICHDSDGHISVEPVIHNHCQCSEPAENAHRETFGGAAFEASADHDHCNDTLLVSDFFVSAQNNIKLSQQKVFTTSLFLRPVSSQTTPFWGHLASQRYELDSFFVPLRTIILLA